LEFNRIPGMREGKLASRVLEERSDTGSEGPSCAVLIASCDAYRDLWTPFFTLFWRYWPDCPYPVYLGANRAAYEDSRVQTLRAGEDASWSNGLRFFLEQIGTDYVFLLLEDFFLDGPFSSSEFADKLRTLDALHGTMLRLNPNPPPDLELPEHRGIGVLHQFARYRVSAQPAIWNRAELLSLLRDRESPWDFERQATLRSQARADGFFSTYARAFSYRHVVEEGRWFWSAARKYERQNIGCDFRARAVISPFTALLKLVNGRARYWRDRLLSWRLNRDLPNASKAARNLRVAFVTNIIPPYHKPVLDRLSRRYGRMRVLVSTPMESNRTWKLEWEGLDVVVQKTLTLRGRWRHPRGFREPLAVHVPLDTLHQLERFRADVVISGEMGARTWLAVLYRKLHRQSRLILWAEVAEATERGRGWARELTRRVLQKHVDAFLATGESGSRYIRTLGVEDERIFKISYTTEISPFMNQSLARGDESARRLLYVGQLIERKGLVPFVRVLSDWASLHSDRSVELRLAGSGPLRRTLEELPVPQNLKLTFMGDLPYENLPKAYSEAGVLVLPTLADTWGVVVNEAMAAGLPVLGSIYAQAVAEMIEDGRSGWVFAAGDRNETFRAIDRCMNTPAEILNEMRACARGRAAQMTPDSLADSIDRAISNSRD
jgi:glycosyltransferase involved in cell wall biosynthesis